jgi:hypothetical protein
MAAFKKLGTIPEEFRRAITPTSSFESNVDNDVSLVNYTNDNDCIQQVVYDLLLDGNVQFKNNSPLEGVIKDAIENNNCYAKCAITLIESYRLDYTQLDQFCKVRYSETSLDRRTNNSYYNTVSQIERILDRLGFTFDLVSKPTISLMEQEKMLNTVKLKCDELVKNGVVDKEKYAILRDKIQRRQDQQKAADEIQQKFQQNSARMSRSLRPGHGGGKKKTRKRRKTRKKN